MALSFEIFGDTGRRESVVDLNHCGGVADGQRRVHVGFEGHDFIQKFLNLFLRIQGIDEIHGVLGDVGITNSVDLLAVDLLLGAVQAANVFVRLLGQPLSVLYLCGVLAAL